MLIDALLDLLLAVLRVLLTPLRMVVIPETIVTTFDAALVYIWDGFSIVAFYTHYNYIMALFTLCMTVYLVIWSYDIVNFVLRHIPFLHIGD